MARSARALLVEETTGVWELVQAGTPVNAEQRGLLRIAATHATATAASVVDRMYTAGGGTAIFASSPLQRCLRDVHAVTQSPEIHSCSGNPLSRFSYRARVKRKSDNRLRKRRASPPNSSLVAR